jgi:hypothetical protein
MLYKIEDIKKALGNGAYLATLALTLTLPDICGQVEYPDEKSSRKLYSAWFNKYVYEVHFKYDGEYKDSYTGTEFDGDACYALRCKYLHNGNTNINKKVEITDFELCITSTDDSGIYVSKFGVTTDLNTSIRTNSVRLDVRDLCNKICMAVAQYYNANKDKGGFKDHSVKIIDMEKWSNSL